MYPWLLRLIVKSLFCINAITSRREIARINLIEMIVSGVSSFSKYFVAMNETPQKITAKTGSRYLYGFVLMIYCHLKSYVNVFVISNEERNLFDYMYKISQSSLRSSIKMTIEILYLDFSVFFADE